MCNYPNYIKCSFFQNRSKTEFYFFELSAHVNIWKHNGLKEIYASTHYIIFGYLSNEIIM